MNNLVAEETACNSIFNIRVNNWFSMLLFTSIFVFNKLTILQENYTKEISGRPDMTFLCKQNRN